MTALLHAELIKLRTTRTFVALAGIAVAISLLLTALVGLLSEPTEESVLIDVFASDVSGFFILVLAVVGISGEWRHRTITSSLLAAPDRLRFLTAKTLAFAAAGILMSLLISIAVTILGLAILTVRDLPAPEAGELADLAARNALVAALLGAFGVGIGALVRNQVVAVVGLLVFSFVVETTLIALVPEVARFGPFTSLPTATAGISAGQAGLGDELELLAPGLAVMAMLAWIGAAFAAGAVLLQRRDLE
jgi:ABC-2 type transport system permease protein